jgi:hypothetical protein
MEIDRIQLQGTIRVERSGSEQQRRRRQENSQEFAEELEQAEEKASPETDHVEMLSQNPLPTSIDVVSIVGARGAIPVTGTYAGPRGAYGVPKPQPAPSPPAESKPDQVVVPATDADGNQHGAKDAEDQGKAVDTLA